MKIPKISIILPTLNPKNYLQQFLISAGKLKYPLTSLEIILINNSLQPLDRLPKLKIKLGVINSRENLGYAPAVNQGVLKAKGDFFFITNDDVSFEPVCLSILTKYAIKNPKVGILGPLVYSQDSPSKISAQDLPGLNSDFFWGNPRSATVKQLADLKKPLEVDWLSGCGLMIKREVIDKIGLFDKRFFTFWEDADFCCRAKKNGFLVTLIPQAKLFHQGSQTAKKENHQKNYYLSRNSLLFLSKNCHWLGLLKLYFSSLALLLVKIIKAIVGNDPSVNWAITNGIWDFYFKRFGKRKR